MTTISFRRRGLGMLAAGALMLGAVVGLAAPANALTLDPEHHHPIDAPLTISPASGTFEAGPTSITSTVGCPEGFRASSRTVLVRPDDGLRILASNRTNAATPGAGLDGNPLNLTGQLATRFEGADGFFQDGASRLLVICDASRQIGTALSSSVNFWYWEAPIYFERATERWSLTPIEGPGEEKVATTTTGTASAVTATSATLTASVSPAAATGTVTFKNGATSLGSAPVTGGSATVPVSGLTAATAYSITAEYGGDAAHEASTGTISFTTEAVADSSESGINVTVPNVASSEPTGLKIAVKPGAVTLTGAGTRTAGQAWTGTGQLGDVSVNDDRRNAAGSAWALNGVVSNFVAGANSIAATNFGWAPLKVSGAGTAGAAVEAGVGGGLSTDKPLATGTASGGTNVETKVGAGLTLKAPADAEGGSYSATLTLTLI